MKPAQEMFAQTVPCNDCPFRVNGGVRHSQALLESYAAYFTTWPGHSFPCHKSVPKDDDRSTWSEWREGQVVCAGGLIFAAKLHRRNALIAIAEAEGWYSQLQHAPDDCAIVFDSVDDMVRGRT